MIEIKVNNHNVIIDDKLNVSCSDERTRVLIKSEIRWMEFDTTGASGTLNGQLVYNLKKKGYNIIKDVDLEMKNKKITKDEKSGFFQKLKSYLKK